MFKLPLFVFLFAFPFLSISQIQISDIEYLQKVDDHKSKKFIQYNQEDYFIEQGLMETKISLVKETGLQLIKEVKDRPMGQGLSIGQSDFSQSNSGAIHEENILYELYPTHIYTIDILTGELTDIIDLSISNTTFQSDFRITSEYYTFLGEQDGIEAYFKFDRGTGELTRIEFSDDKTVNRINDQLYYFDEATGEFMAHHMITNATELVATAETGHFTIKQTTFNGEDNLLVTEGDGNTVYFINAQNEFRPISCLDNINPEEIYLLSDQIMYIKSVDDVATAFVIDANTCEQQVAFELFSLYFKFRDSRDLWGEYVLLSNQNGWAGFSTFYIYDIADQNFTEIFIPADLAYFNTAVRYDNSLYLRFHDDIHHIGILPELLKLDLETKTYETIVDYDRYYIYDVVVGEPREDQSLNIYFDTEDESAIIKYNHVEQAEEKIHEFDYSKNIGIHYSIYESLWHGEKLFFYTSEALYVMDNEEVKLIMESDSEEGFFSCSGFVIKDETLHALVYSGSQGLSIQVDVNDYSLTTQEIAGLTVIDYRRPETEYAIVNIPNLHSASTGYYSLSDKQFKPFTINGQTFKTSSYILSGNNLLLSGYAENQGQSIIFDTQSETGKTIDIPNGEYPTAFPDGKGGFYLIPWHLTTTVDPDFLYLDANGNASVLVSDFAYTAFYDGERLDGNVKSIAFDAEEDLIIFSEKDGEIHLTHIPDDGALYYQRFFWKHTDEMSVLEVRNGTNYDTYIFSFGTTPIKITPNGRLDRLQQAFIEEDKIVLMYFYRPTNTLSFEEYHFSTGEIIPRNSVTIDNTYIQNEDIEFTDGKYMIRLAMNNRGLEPWIYNSTSGILTLAKDIRSGFQSSDPKGFFQNPSAETSYFLAITNKGDRQIFKIDETVNVEELELENLQLTIFPNPASIYLSINQSLILGGIYDANGRLVKVFNNYQELQQLDISVLSDGVYFIKGISGNQESFAGKFIKQK